MRSRERERESREREREREREGGGVHTPQHVVYAEAIETVSV